MKATLEIEEKVLICPYCGKEIKLELDYRRQGYFLPLSCPKCGSNLSEVIEKARKVVN